MDFFVVIVVEVVVEVEVEREASGSFFFCPIVIYFFFSADSLFCLSFLLLLLLSHTLSSDFIFSSIGKKTLVWGPGGAMAGETKKKEKGEKNYGKLFDARKKRTLVLSTQSLSSPQSSLSVVCPRWGCRFPLENTHKRGSKENRKKSEARKNELFCFLRVLLGTSEEKRKKRECWARRSSFHFVFFSVSMLRCSSAAGIDAAAQWQRLRQLGRGNAVLHFLFLLFLLVAISPSTLALKPEDWKVIRRQRTTKRNERETERESIQFSFIDEKNDDRGNRSKKRALVFSFLFQNDAFLFSVPFAIMGQSISILNLISRKRKEKQQLSKARTRCSSLSDPEFFFTFSFLLRSLKLEHKNKNKHTEMRRRSLLRQPAPPPGARTFA